MLDDFIKGKLRMFVNDLLNKDYRLENIEITTDNDFIYVEALLKNSEYIKSVLRISDMIELGVYDSESVYRNIKCEILDIIEREYRKKLVGALTE